ncbi:MAG TPA: hypothetical protein VFV91_14425 [Gaiellaceae bacterium]|nr:hypothetical protein [Gaiellaceae bacterium]
MSISLPKEPSTTYTAVRPSLGTGDLFFLHGTSQAGVMVENLEVLAGWPPYSHIGMVIADGDSLFFWDAPGDGGLCFPDPYATDPDNRIYGKYTGANGAHKGCRVSELDDVLAYYSTKTDAGGFWLRQLHPAVTLDRFDAVRRFINRVDGMPFPTGPGTLPFGFELPPEVTGLGANFLAGQDRASFFFGTYFCAQLVADSYMHMGLLDMELFPPNGYTPAAFTMDGTTRLPLVSPATLGPVTFVEWNGQAKNQPCDCPDYNPPPPAN